MEDYRNPKLIIPLRSTEPGSTEKKPERLCQGRLNCKKAKQLHTELGLTNQSVLLVFSSSFSLRNNTEFQSQYEYTVKLL